MYNSLDNGFQREYLTLIDEPLTRAASSPLPIPEQLTFEQQPPKIRASMAPAASHCGMVSIKMRPIKAIILDEAGRGSSMPYISAFSKDGRASMILGVIVSPSAVVLEACRSRRVDRRRGALMDVGCVLLESALRRLAIRCAWVFGWRLVYSFGRLPVCLSACILFLSCSSSALNTTARQTARGSSEAGGVGDGGAERIVTLWEVVIASKASTASPENKR